MKGKSGIVALALSVLICVSLIVLFNSQYENLKESHSIAVGTIVNSGGGGKGSAGKATIYYSFLHNGKQIEDSDWTKELSRATIQDSLIGKSFPVLVGKGWFGINSVILITPHDFNRYAITFPDSLKWIIPLLIEN
jgi:hypothetical protein